MNILICGATGFIGRNMVEILSRNKDFNITAVYNKRDKYDLDSPKQIKWINSDLRDPRSIKGIFNNIDIVIQAAATTSGSKDIVNSPYLHVTDNAVMNSYLLKEAYDSKVKHFIFFSCTVMYQSSNKALKESDWNSRNDLHPRYFGVGHTKLYIERMLEFYSQISDMKCTAIRHTNIYGDHDKYDLEKSHVFGATITKVMTAQEHINIWGTGEEERDLLHVYDLASFVEAVIQNQQSPYEMYHCGLGQKISILDLVKKIIKISGKDFLEIKHDLSQPTIKTSLFLDCSKAMNELGWSPKITLDEGIRLTIDWWKKNIT